MKIYSPSDNHKLLKIQFAARIYGVELQHQQIPFNHRHKPFQEQYANFSIPALYNNQRYIFGTNTILREIQPQNIKFSPFRQAEIDQWLELIERDLEQSVGVLVLSQKQSPQIKEQHIKKAKDVAIKIGKMADDRLKLKTFLVGESLTLADISLYFSWTAISKQIEKQQKCLVNLNRWCSYIASINSN